MDNRNIYITGDCHGNFDKIASFCREYHTTRNDIMIILGDAGINFSNTLRDRIKKQCINSLPITLFCIHGNHEMRPTKVFDVTDYGEKTNKKSYHLKKWHGGKVYVESAFPSILFARDGEVFDLNGISTLVCGGAYSPDKPQHLANMWPWFPDEQPDNRIKRRVEKKIESLGWKVDVMLTHTIPSWYLPFLHLSPWPGIDRSTELWLDRIENKLDYKKWYAGHFHVDMTIGKLEILMDTIEPFYGSLQSCFMNLEKK